MGNTRDRIKLKSLLALALCLTMALGLAACGQQTNMETPTETAAPAQTGTPAQTEAPEPTEEPEPVDEEIAAAIALGLVPEELRGDYDKQMIYREYCALLDALVEKVRPDKSAKWLEVSADFRDSTHTMTRFEGMLLLLYAAECMDLDAEGFRMMLILSDVAGDAYWDDMFSSEVGEKDGYSTVGMERISQLYYDEIIANSEWYWRCENDYVFNSVMFGAYCSYQNGRPYFDYDEHFLLRTADDLTREAAIHAVSRLYGTAIYATFEPYDGTRFQLSEEAWRQAREMPEVSYDKLPAWHGFTINFYNPESPTSGRRFDSSLVELMAGYGFDFVRVPLDMSQLFDGTDVSRICPAEFQELNDLLESCAKHQIHVCLDIHEMPGFYTAGDRNEETLFTEAETQELFARYWGALADYYRDIPTNLLSFNLLNEPHIRFDSMPSDEVYSRVMRMGIDAIHTVTPDRLIFVDVMGVFDGEPIEGLADQPIVQAIHTYPHDGTMQYPSYQICESIHRDFGAVEFRGAFSEGTKLTINLTGIYSDEMTGESPGGALTVLADGEAVGTFAFSAAAAEIDIETGVVRTVTLDKAASKISIEQAEGKWYSHNWIALETNTYMIQLLGERTYRNVSSTAPILSVNADGTFTAERADTVYTLDIGAIREVYAKYEDFTARTGQLFIVQEFGYNDTLLDAAACPMAEDYFTVWEELGMPWCVWADNYSPVISKETVWYRDIFWGRNMLHKDGNYEPAAENYLVDTRLLEVFQRHMN